ncbi:Flp pilus assembly protein CpaB [Rugamonas sp. CCM 8940]|uniref:Flp pilus assembly protein CpaB n=1 Tax=Rugamonas sp. CCM 8940 TaxID=2765359 RepID=UPI0018F42BCC|nr:Flp pilus assembly protein CpaB [Rugamonas sp. CCM 8940]MBJ7311684.1 Flp pilus assembly protein CpaB [Rugamonas sp. CCM 8940]
MNLDRIKRLRHFRPGKTWLVLGIALAIGGLAAFAARSYLSNQVAVIEARGKGKSVQVVVAKVDIARGVKLDNHNVAVRNVPAEFAHSVAVLPDDFPRIDGQALAFPVKAGEMILWGLVESPKAPAFSSRVESGRRAMTVPVDEINSISGMLEPGDLIDLIVTVEQAGKKLTFPLLQRVPVMATGQRAADDAQSGDRRQYSTVTVDTTPAQAQSLIMGREVGKLTALLRNPQDDQPIGNETVDLAALLGMKGSLKAGPGGGRGGRGDAVAAGPSMVPVIYGNGKMPPEAVYLRRAASRAKGAAPAAPAPADEAEEAAPRAAIPTIGMR